MFLLHFFQILIFGVNSGKNGGKMAQNDKKLCLLHSISQGAYIIWDKIFKSGLSKFFKGCLPQNLLIHSWILCPIWSWFLVDMCKMITSPDHFFIFSRFWFSGLLGGKREKKWPKMTKILICPIPYLRKYTSHDCGFWYACVKWYVQQFFPFFQNSDFLGF